MDTRSSKLIATLYIAIALVAAGVIYYGYHAYLGPYFRKELADTSTTTQQRGAIPASIPSASRAPNVPRPSVNDQIHTIRQLRDLLDKRTSSLQQQNAQLQRKSAEFEELRAEADEYLAVLLDILSQDERTDQSQDRQPSNAVADSKLDTKKVESPIAGEAPKSDVRANEIAVMRTELELAQARIVELEMSILQELEMSSEAGDALVATGAPAVPALITVLSNKRPELRRWAAMVLGRIGPDAIEAEPALDKALEDPDLEVRSAAQWALKQIDDR